MLISLCAMYLLFMIETFANGRCQLLHIILTGTVMYILYNIAQLIIETEKEKRAK